MGVNRKRYGCGFTIPKDAMVRTDDTVGQQRRVAGAPKVILWQNIAALMRHKYGCENLNQLARDAKISPGTVARVKKLSNSTGIDVLEKIASGLHVQIWQLMLPGLDPANIPVTMLSEAERKFHERIKRVDHILKEDT